MLVGAQELCESRGKRPWLPFTNLGLCGRKEIVNLNPDFLSPGAVKVEVAALGTPSLIIRTVSVDVAQH